MAAVSRRLLLLCLLLGRAAGARVAQGEAAGRRPLGGTEAVVLDGGDLVVGAGGLRCIVEDLERLLQPGTRPAERELLDAVVRAELALARSAGQTAPPGSLAALVRLCRGLVGGPGGAELRRHALGVLGWVAAAGGEAATALLPSIAMACQEAFEAKDVAAQFILHAIDSLGQHEGSDAATLERITALATKLVFGALHSEEDQELPDVWEPATQHTEFQEDLRPRFIFEILGVVFRYAHRAAVHLAACRSLAKLSRHVAEGTVDVIGFLSVRLMLLDLLRTVAPVAVDGPAIAEMLLAVEACADDEWIIINHMAGEALHALSRKVDDDDLERVVELSIRETLASQPGGWSALDVVQLRLLEEDYQGPTEVRLALLARVLAIEERRRRFVPCTCALDLLDQLPAPEPLSHTALRSMALRGFAPPLDVALHIDDFLPFSAEEEARSQIVEVCARTSTGTVTRAWLVLQAVCTQPRRVSLRALHALAVLVESTTSSLAAGFSRAPCFAFVGMCLSQDPQFGAVSAVDEYLLNVDAALVQRIASRVLEIAAALDIGRRWPRSVSRLCQITGNQHTLCRETFAIAA